MADAKTITLHPDVAILKAEIKRERCTYSRLALGTGIPEQRIKNLMTGRTEMLLSERDRLCRCLNILPVNLISRESCLDISMLNDGIRQALLRLHMEISKNSIVRG